MKPLVIGIAVAVVAVGAFFVKQATTPAMTFQWTVNGQNVSVGTITNTTSQTFERVSLWVPVSVTKGNFSVQTTQEGKCFGMRNLNLKPGQTFPAQFFAEGLTENTAPEIQSPSGAVRISLVR
jgi:hypothetical protein